MALPAPIPLGQPAATTPVQFSVGGSLTPEIIAVLEALGITGLQKALDSGAKKYQVGSRQLERYELEQYLKVLQFTRNTAASISPNGSMSAIQTRRGVPCDV